MRVIKRYANRKLYDTQDNAYVTLEALQAMIRAGEEVQVVDHASGADLTTLTLLQILFEQEKQSGGIFSPAALERMIRVGSRTISDIKEGLRAFGAPVEHAEGEIRRRLAALEARGQISPEERERLETLLLAREEKPEAAAPQEVADLAAQVEALQKELEALRARSAGATES